MAKFFQSAKPEPATANRSASVGGAAKDNKIAVKDTLQIQQLIETAVVHGSAIVVRIPGEKIRFTTYFSTTNANDFKTTDGQWCLLVAPLDPPLGNIKMRGAPYLTISFFTDLFVVESRVNYLKNLEDRSIQLSFPTAMFRSPQKRSSARIVVDPKMNIQAKIRRPAGLTFAVKIYDICVGGVAFYSDDTIPPMLENTRLVFTISRPAQRDIEITAVILGVFNKDEKTCYRAIFGHKEESLKEVEKLVQSLVNKNQAKRQKLFQ